MNRRSEIVTAGAASIETYVDGHGPAVVIISSYGRDGGEDFDFLSAALVDAGYRVLRSQPRGVAGSVGPMTGVGFDDMAHDIASSPRRSSAIYAFTIASVGRHFDVKRLSISR